MFADYILDREFAAELPNRKWLADVACAWTAEGRLHVAVVLDLVSRRGGGWSMNAERDATLAMGALMTAAWRRGEADALFHHPDQGSHHSNEPFQRRLEAHGIPSVPGDAWDDSAMESVVSSLKAERIRRKVHCPRDATRADVFDDTERFCTPRRRHSKLGDLSPMAFKERAMQT